MTKRILKRIRNFRILSGLLITFLTILSFQNCAPQNSLCSGNSSDCKSGGSTSSPSTGKDSIWDSRPGNGNSSGVGVGGGSGGGGSVSIGSGSNSGTGNGGGISVGGGGSSGGGSGSSGGGGSVSPGGSGSNGNNNTAFRITKQPQSVVVTEKAQFVLDVSLAGGSAPYTYQWYKDNQPITNGMGEYSSYMDSAYSFAKDGNYHVVVKDGKGQSVQSTIARVTVQEQAGNCDAGSYFTFTNATYDSGYQYFSEYFDSPRGKFLLHQSFDTMGFLYSYRSYTKLYDYNVPSTLAYLGKTYISCRTEVPRIHTPQPNPDNNYDYYSRYDDNGYWTYQGNIAFECHNKRLKLVSNTCKWVYNPNYNPPGGGGGGG